MGTTGIDYVTKSWNIVHGCDPVSEGCQRCWAKRMARRLRGRAGYPTEKDGFAVTIRPDRLCEPLGWKTPERVAVGFMGDLFHDEVDEKFIAKVFAIMALGLRHTFQVLTKRPERMRDYLAARGKSIEPWERAVRDEGFTLKFDSKCLVPFPLPNVWLGVSAEDQERADERIPHLLDTPAAVRFVSAEPLLGPIEFDHLLGSTVDAIRGRSFEQIFGDDETPRLDWVIVGGESGPKARPMHPDWARDIRDQCKAAGIPFFFKQWGEWHGGHWSGCGSPAYFTANDSRLKLDLSDHEKWKERVHWFDHESAPDGPGAVRVGKKAAGHLLDGREHREWPRGAGHGVSP